MRDYPHNKPAHGDRCERIEYVLGTGQREVEEAERDEEGLREVEEAERDEEQELQETHHAELEEQFLQEEQEQHDEEEEEPEDWVDDLEVPGLEPVT